MCAHVHTYAHTCHVNITRTSHTHWTFYGCHTNAGTAITAHIIHTSMQHTHTYIYTPTPMLHIHEEVSVWPGLQVKQTRRIVYEEGHEDSVW